MLKIVVAPDDNVTVVELSEIRDAILLKTRELEMEVVIYLSTDDELLQALPALSADEVINLHSRKH